MTDIETWEDGSFRTWMWYSLREVKQKLATSGKEVFLKVRKQGEWEYWWKPRHCKRFRRGWA